MTRPDNIPVAKGTYVLILRQSRTRKVSVGSLGSYPFTKGWYAYVGSARGPGGLAGRLNHHLSVADKPHWHIDYLRRDMPLVDVWFGLVEREHDWATLLAGSPGATIPVRRLGASDCRCDSHLIMFAAKPDFEIFSKLVEATFPTDAKIQQTGDL